MGNVKSIVLVYPGVIYSKKNSKRIIKNPRTGKPQIVSSGNAKDQEIEMMWLFNSQTNSSRDWEKFDKPLENYEGRGFEVEVTIYQKDRTRRDLDNQLTAVLDGLVAANVIPDDCNKFVKMLMVRQGGIDKENPRAEIQITEVTNEEDEYGV